MAMGVITATVSNAAARARAMGIWSGTFGVGMAAGPVVGGVLADGLGWRSLFWINIPVGVIAILVAGLVIPAMRADHRRRLDPVGQVLVIVFLACLTYGIIEGPSAGWGSPPIVAAFAISAGALVLLLPWERGRVDPLVDLRVFRSLPFSGALVITVCAFVCLGGFLFLTTLYLQDVRGLTAWQAGVQLIPLAATTAAAGPAAGRVMARRGGRGLFVVAGAAFAVSCLLLALAPARPALALLLGSYAFFGAGYGAVNAVIADAAVAGMPRARAGVAGGMTSAGRQAGQSLGVSVAGAVLAAGLHGPLRDGFAAASRPVWLVLAAAGFVVLPLGIAITSGRALRTAQLVAEPVRDHAPRALRGATADGE